MTVAERCLECLPGTTNKQITLTRRWSGPCHPVHAGTQASPCSSSLLVPHTEEQYAEGRGIWYLSCRSAGLQLHKLVVRLAKRLVRDDI